MYSDPGEAGIECTPFVATAASSSEVSVYDNGLMTGRTEWIGEGILNQLRYHRAGAARSGVPLGPYIDNLALRCVHGGGVAGARAGSSTVDDMVADTERGLLLTCLWYIRDVDPSTLLQTGLTRDGVYLVENGAVVAAANNFRFNESPVDLLARATEVGTPVRTIGREFGEYINRVIMPPPAHPRLQHELGEPGQLSETLAHSPVRSTRFYQNRVACETNTPSPRICSCSRRNGDS